jgi:hypothetical protein
MQIDLIDLTDIRNNPQTQAVFRHVEPRIPAR